MLSLASCFRIIAFQQVGAFAIPHITNVVSSDITNWCLSVIIPIISRVGILKPRLYLSVYLFCKSRDSRVVCGTYEVL